MLSLPAVTHLHHYVKGLSHKNCQHSNPFFLSSPQTSSPTPPGRCPMDLGIASGNFVVLPDPEPPFLPIRCELHVYTYLRRSPGARIDLFIRAQAARSTSWSQVFVHHRHLLFPILLDYTTTDADLLNILDERIKQFFQHLHHIAHTALHAPPPASTQPWIVARTWKPDTSWEQ